MSPSGYSRKSVFSPREVRIAPNLRHSGLLCSLGALDFKAAYVSAIGRVAV
jgi:hypothetical protein